MKIFFLAIVTFLSFSSNLFSGGLIYESNGGYTLTFQELYYDNFRLNIFTPDWQPRSYYYGVFPNSIGYFYVNSWDGSMGIFGSNRYVLEDNVEAFYHSLIPLEENLLPYAVPSSSQYVAWNIISVEDTYISGTPAKQIIFALDHENPDYNAMVISYILTKPRSSLIHYNKIAGYTYSISFYRSDYEKQKEKIDTLVKNLIIY